jgi:hypothetical protein
VLRQGVDQDVVGGDRILTPSALSSACRNP